VDVFSGVCLFVSLFVNTITSERLNIERCNLAVRCIVQKSILARVRMSRSKVKVTGTKNEEVRHFFGSRPLGLGPRIMSACSVSNTKKMLSLCVPVLAAHHHSGGRVLTQPAATLLATVSYFTTVATSRNDERRNHDANQNRAILDRVVIVIAAFSGNNK